jgi:hypothetical protein
MSSANFFEPFKVLVTYLESNFILLISCLSLHYSKAYLMAQHNLFPTKDAHDLYLVLHFSTFQPPSAMVFFCRLDACALSSAINQRCAQKLDPRT